MAVVASTGTELKFTAPLPVVVVMTILPPSTTSLVVLKITPVDVPVVMTPFSVVVPEVVTLKLFNGVVDPTAPRTILPVPLKVRPVAPLISPPTVKVLPESVTVGLLLKAMAPVPRFKALVPPKVKLAFQFIALLFKVTKLPKVLSIVPPLIVNVLVPKAPALLRSSVPPALKVTVLLKMLMPVKTKAPEVTVSVPETVVDAGRVKTVPTSL